MRNLITDRTRENTLRLQELSVKGISGMSEAERKEWLGDPLEETAVNLLPYGPNYSSSVAVEHFDDAIIATANNAGVYLYSISIIGESSKYEGKTFTLSADFIGTVDGGTPQIALYWHDDNGFEYAGASLTEAGSVTFTVSENTAGRAYLALYIYVTTDAEVQAGATARFSKVMLENGAERHEYVPYTEVLPTPATKGAYNYSDLNRVERAVAEISRGLGLNLTTKTDWGMWDIPRSSDMERYLNNIRILRDALSLESAIPETINELTYSGANSIEAVLYSGYERLKSSLCCGELFCGEV